ncbi:pentatricopeptide repeat-containing protein At4g02750 [Selaginella moellendorffii]|uniref:pentatricopeptide repeat-containing protein At4g02750 n=1 Tax=Selaginella moellendorffii TaxID=88036 RepID=UPI000D1CD8BF|nr:pentatricopeptide repeat-containing protein At4g02750 [Selaginella moellendorffii]|eukprot:XP_002969222.2 pentatricopeptide repeat-containing protein At4g02750 [Selaginella moellendorffii]
MGSLQSQSPWADLAKQVTRHRKLSEAERESKRRDGNSTHFFADQLKSCKSLTKGRQIHTQILETKHYRNIFLANLVIEMYGKCGSAEEALRVFEDLSEPNIFSWNILLAALSRNGEIDRARMAFEKMPVRDAVSGFVGEARNLLFAMPQWDPVSWTTVIAAYAAVGDSKEAVILFRMMDLEGIPADGVAFAAVLDACASHSTLSDGAAIHASILESGFAISTVVSTGLVNMYGKCGRLREARAIFDAIAFRERDLVLWTSMIAAYAQWGRGEAAIEAFQSMLLDGIAADEVVFISVLCACSHAGLLELGCQYFASIEPDYRVAIGVHHYACAIDLLGKAGWLDEAESLIERMPFDPDGACWTALLAACKLHKDGDRAERASERAMALDPDSAAPYALLVKIQGGGEASEQTTRRRLERGVRKLVPGCSSIVVRDRVHEFTAGAMDHPRAAEIYEELERLRAPLAEAGYVPDTGVVIQAVDEREKERIVLAHSEKLAVAFGLLATPANSPLRVVNNLRMCSDCHSAMKFIASITRREIVVRDLIRFHRFDEQGRCSCGDYW